ncbi:NAD(P)H-hydrate dehydratase [Nicoliella spurrieriana]|uniref:ADP-dependent (S)-NAD(P)H-hydrate dehydratase n=1 Tax=Nicoliella spurrieriana TaxID=2925830 RepID=A0A976RS27_9LACO|nr:NAD(P)H-hydrate dehydratase [Nicoliella spurrieriana]UQS86754.1 NAD(P)H-hydrate dehydratase [Nicoliella spurrieriana]
MKYINQATLKQTIRVRPDNSFKGTYGHITLVGGNANFGGAIIMATMAAVYSGAGLVTTLTDPANKTSIHAQLPEAMVADYHNVDTLTSSVQGADVIVIGCGLGTDAEALAVLKTVFKTVTPEQLLIIDGSAITMVATEHLSLPDARIILTPHQIEWQRLSGIKLADQSDVARNQTVRDQLNAIVVLKSHRTQVYTKDDVYENTAGTPAQATGGMGDTLAGMVGGFVAQFANKENAVAAAVYAHSAIADQLAQNQYVVLPHQIIHHIPQFMKQNEADK